MPGFSTDAILLRKTEYGDHDFIISFLTQTRGKVSVIAKNAKKSVRRFNGALDLFSANHIQCTLPKKKKDALTILAQADLDNGFGNIRHNVFKTAYACLWVELVHSFLEEDKPQPELYELLLFSLYTLNAGVVSGEVTSLLFLIRFMKISGFDPAIDTCGRCRTPLDRILDSKVTFDFKDGRIFCSRCAPVTSRFGMQVSKGTLKQLFWINHNHVSRVDRIRFSNFAIREGERLLESFIPYHIGKEFKSLQFLKRLRQET